MTAESVGGLRTETLFLSWMEENCVLILGETISRVSLNGFDIAMPASKNDLGFELGHLLSMIMEDRWVFESLLDLDSAASANARQTRMLDMLARAKQITDENSDIVVRHIPRL